MTLARALRWGREALAAAAIEEPHIVAELLLMHLLGISRAKLLTEPDIPLTSAQDSEYRRLIARAAQGEPAAYITGHREFYGTDLHVDRRVLIPRPETELLVERAILLSRRHDIQTIADIGTGSGAIAISLALNLPAAKLYATDISESALEVARINCQKHGVLDRITFRQGDLLAALPEPVDLLVANLPYVKSSELCLSRGLGFEPRLALDGGEEGLDAIRRLATQLKEKLNPGGYLLLEIGAGQAAAVCQLLAGVYPEACIRTFSDLQGILRVVELILTDLESRVFSNQYGKSCHDLLAGKPN